jgi:hypothetical protein
MTTSGPKRTRARKENIRSANQENPLLHLATHRPETPEFRTSQYELHGIEEVRFPGTVPSDDAIHLGREGVYLRLLLEGAEVR